MKPLIPFISITIVLCFSLFPPAYAQATQTLVLQPGSSGMDASVNSVDANGNYGEMIEFYSSSWTAMGDAVHVRSFLRFDLSTIPQRTKIHRAVLHLYNSSVASIGYANGEHSVLSNPNTSLLRRVTSPWEENTITWNKQPTSTNMGEVLLPSSTSPHQDYACDVTALVQEMVNNPSRNFGFVLQLLSESPYCYMVFASSDHPDASVRPTLVITLDGSVALQPSCISAVFSTGEKSLQDAVISEELQATNSGHSPNCTAAVGMNDTPTSMRSLLRFNLSSIPQDAIINEALLVLYNPFVPGSYINNHQHIVGSNASVLQRVTEAWDEFAVTWNNQPQVTEEAPVHLPQSARGNQNYVLDIKNHAEFWLKHPDQNFGLLLKLQNENGSNRLLFASSNFEKPLLHPQLQICYTVAKQPSIPDSNEVPLYKEEFIIEPNPFLHECRIRLRRKVREMPFSITMYDAVGKKVRTVFEGKISGSNNVFVWDGRNEYGESIGQAMYYCRIYIGTQSFLLPVAKN